MNVRTFLGLLSDRPLSTINPEGQQVIELLNKYTNQPHSIGDLTGITTCELIDGMCPEDRDEIYVTELNDGMDLVKYRRELQSLLDQKDTNGKRLRQVLAFGMATLLAALTISLCFAIGYVAWIKNELPPWELCLIAFGGPAMVVWQYNGVLTQERKDFLAAALGRTPQASILGDLLNGIGNSRDLRRRRDDFYEEDLYPRSRPRNRLVSDPNKNQHGDPPAI